MPQRRRHVARLTCHLLRPDVGANPRQPRLRGLRPRADAARVARVEAAGVRGHVPRLQRAATVVTRIALSPAWRYGSLLAVLALLVAAIAGRRRIPWLPLVAALLAIAICAGTYWAAEWPVYQLAGSIQP